MEITIGARTVVAGLLVFRKFPVPPEKFKLFVYVTEIIIYNSTAYPLPLLLSLIFVGSCPLLRLNHRRQLRHLRMILLTRLLILLQFLPRYEAIILP